MTLIRKPIGPTHEYRGHTIEARFIGPDLLGYVDGTELPHFYISAAAVHKAGERYIDDMLKERR